MAAVTPVTKGTAGYCPPGSIFLNHAAASPNTLTQARLTKTAGLRHQRFHFADLDNTELWTTVPGAVAFALALPGDTSATDSGVSMNAARQALHSAGTNNEAGILHVWSKGQRIRETGTDAPPVTKGTAGYLNPSSTFLRQPHNDGGSDPFVTDQTPPFALTAAGKYCPTSQGQFRHVPLYFTGVNGAGPDTWTPNARTLPRVVDWAWQPAVGAAADRIVLTVGATAVTFYGDADSDGWLHLWFRG